MKRRTENLKQFRERYQQAGAQRESKEQSAKEQERGHKTHLVERHGVGPHETEVVNDLLVPLVAPAPQPSAHGALHPWEKARARAKGMVVTKTTK